MKFTRCCLKFIAFMLAAAAVLCCIVAYWDKIVELFDCLRDRLAEHRCCLCHSEDCDDWDE